MIRCGNAEDFKATRKERNKNWPPHLSRQRPRALTLPIPSEFAKPDRWWNPFRQQRKQQTFDQSQSILFGRLPMEIRRSIWVEFLGGQLLHLVRAPKRLVGIPCNEPLEIVVNGLDTSRHDCWLEIPMQIPMGLTGFYYGPHLLRPANFLHLLQTCRLVYTETIAILYEENTFDINHPDTVLYMQRSLLPRRLNQIKFMNVAWDFKYGATSTNPPYDLDTWRRACNVLATLVGLRELTMHLTGTISFVSYTGRRWEPVLASLTCITAKAKFDVYIPWSEEECMEAAKEKGHHFRLMAARPLWE